MNSSTGFPVIETLNAEFQSRKWLNPVPQVTFRDWETIRVEILKREISRIRKFQNLQNGYFEKVVLCSRFFRAAGSQTEALNGLWTVQVYFDWVYFATYFAMVYFPTLSLLLIISNKIWVPLKSNWKSGSETFSKSKAKVILDMKSMLFFQI